MLFVAIASACPPAAMAQALDSKEPAAPPKAEDAATDISANELMRIGIARYRKKDFEGARAAFMKAWKLDPHTEIAGALADVEMKLGHYRDAAEHWDYYLNYHPPDQDEARDHLAECRKHVGSIQLEVSPPEADVVVDGRRMSATARKGALWLEPGQHTIVARYEGRSSPEQAVDVAAGNELTMRLEVPVPTPATRVVVSAAPAPPPRSTAQKNDRTKGIETRTIVLVGGTVLTAAAITVGIISVLRASSAESSRVSFLREIRAETPPSVPDGSMCSGEGVSDKCDDLAQKVDERVAAENLALGSFIAGGVLGAATLATYFLWPASEKSASARGVVVAPLAARKGGGLQVRMQF